MSYKSYHHSQRKERINLPLVHLWSNEHHVPPRRLPPRRMEWRLKLLPKTIRTRHCFSFSEHSTGTEISFNVDYIRTFFPLSKKEDFLNNAIWSPARVCSSRTSTCVAMLCTFKLGVAAVETTKRKLSLHTLNADTDIAYVCSK